MYLKFFTISSFIFSSNLVASDIYIRNGDVYHNQGDFFFELGSSHQSDLYKSQKDNDFVLVNLGYNGYDLNADLYGLNYRFLGDDTNGLNLNIFIGNGFDGYDSSDAEILNDLSDRKYSIDAGIGLDYYIYQNTVFSFSVEHDISDAYNGITSDLTLNQILGSKNFSFAPYLKMRYLSKDHVDYYYGVNENETSKQRSYYSPNADFQFSLGYGLNYSFGKNWLFKQSSTFTAFGSEVSNSPLIDEDYFIETTFSFAYIF